MQSLEIVILGVGAGETAVYSREASSSFVIVADGKPVLLVDSGLGVVASCLHHVGSLPTSIYISHNHTDHAGELPVLLAVESVKHRMHVYAHGEVLDRLLAHRLHELRSTGRPLSSFAEFVRLTTGEETHALQEPAGGQLSIQLVQARHSEICFGFLLLYKDEPVLGWTADSGFNLEMYRWLACAPVLLIDARAVPTPEHAGFQEVDSLLDFPEFEGRKVYVTGYGAVHQAPRTQLRVRTAHPGDRIQLLPSAEEEDEAAPAAYSSYWGPGAFGLGWGRLDTDKKGLKATADAPLVGE